MHHWLVPIQASPMVVVGCKFKVIKLAINNWNKEVFGT